MKIIIIISVFSIIITESSGEITLLGWLTLVKFRHSESVGLLLMGTGRNGRFLLHP